jgi:hypothetical protein
MPPLELLAFYSIGAMLLVGAFIIGIIIIWGRRDDEEPIRLRLPEGEPEDWRDGIPEGWRVP